MLLGGKLVSWRSFAVIFVAAGFFLVFVYFLHEFPGAFHVQVQLLWQVCIGVGVTDFNIT